MELIDYTSAFAMACGLHEITFFQECIPNFLSNVAVPGCGVDLDPRFWMSAL